MPAQPAILFDDNAARLGPLTDLRPAFDIRTGARTTLDRLRHELLGGLDVRGLAVPAHLVDLTTERHSPAAHPSSSTNAPCILTSGPGGGGLPWFVPGLLLVNGRCVVPLDEIARLETGQSLVESISGHLIACRPLTREDGEHVLRTFTPPRNTQAISHDRPVLIQRPWHVRTFLEDALSTDLVSMSSNADEPELRGVMAYGDAPLSIHTTAKVRPGVVFDVEHGPVFVDQHAEIRPGAVIIGPAYIGSHSTVLERAIIRAHTSIGPWCKVAGEVGGTVFQGFSNKAHDGYLGDSIVGEWVNLGAGTTNSNLLNTYGEVTMRAAHDAPLERTGRQFMGCVIGDHVKTAIATRIMTGSTIGTGSMIAQSAAVSGAVAPFTWATDDSPAGSGKAFRKEKFLEIARTALSRRKQTLSTAQTQRLITLAGWT